MVSDRKSAKQAIQGSSDSDAELSEALSAAHHFQLKIAQENNRQAEVMRRIDVGAIGWAFGGEKSAPTSIALMAVLGGILGSIFSWYMAANISLAAEAEFWSTQAERSLAFASSALAFIFGRGAK